MSQARAPEPDRDRTHQIDKALDTLALRPGMVVAEVGAGPGCLVEKLALRVGPEGKIYAEDISARMLEMFRNIVPSLKPGGRLVLIEPVQGQAADPLDRPISDSRHRTRDALLDIFSKAGLRVERIDPATVPFDTVFVLAPVGRQLQPQFAD